MISFGHLLPLAAVVFSASSMHTASLMPIHERCSIGPSDHPAQFNLRVWEGDCDGEHHCSSNFNHDPFSRLTGITRADLEREGAALTATMTAEAGTFNCSGKVHEGLLTGDATFTPDETFVDRMARMGFSGYTAEKLEAYAFVNVETAWVRSISKPASKG